MELILSLIYLVLIVMIVALIGKEGLWSNTVTLVNVVTAALLATNFWEPMTRWSDSQFPSMVHVADFLIIWSLFALFYTAMRALTDLASKLRVRFPNALNQAGGFLMAAVVGWVIVCFLGMTLHMAPLAREFMGGMWQAEKPSMFGLSPDRQWLGFMQKESLGAFSRLTPADDPEGRVFDPRGEFLAKYAARRQILEKQPGLRAVPSLGGPAKK
ncbi:MAG TPA: CvpA family protein [Pirellulales bacterium]|jgi:hypothetical protein